MKTAIFIPTLNGASTAPNLLAEIFRQSGVEFELRIIDSESTDNTISIFESNGVQIHPISGSTFNHGATRQSCVEMSPDADIIVFMTQDAILAHPESLKLLLDCFEDDRIGAAYGCQVPNVDASPIAAHARLFNYPSQSSVKSLSDCSRLGIKTAFLSNSFAAYRRSALMSVGGFPSMVILGEDTYVAGKMILSGWKIAYCANAQVYHSHNYSVIEEFRRYFDIGVFHSREKWLLESIGKAEGEGKKFVISEFRYLLKQAPLYIPSALLRTFFKYLGYKLGWMEGRIPKSLKIKASMNKGFWK